MIYDYILYGTNEFNNDNDKKYYILKVDNIKKEKYMIDIFEKFIQNKSSNIKENHYLGLDFEYNKVSKTKRDIALMQINLENESNIGYIFILYPPDMKKKNYNILIKLLTQKDIIKILHGGESLDIPYLFDQLLITEENINNFCSNFYDTKYLCDYKYKKDCSIYKLLLSTNIINQKKYDELDNIEDIIGPIYLINIDIYNLDPNVLKYSLYDVIYLPDLVKYFLQYDIIYKYIISEIAIIIHKYKRNIDTKFLELEKYINTINLCYFYYNNQKYIFNNIWKIYYDIILDENEYMITLFDINYFRNFLKIITKFIIYQNLSNKFKIYKSKNNFIKIDLSKYNKWLSSYTYFNKLIKEYNYLFILDLNEW